MKGIAEKYPVKVVTGPDKKRDRGKKLRPSPVKEEALSLGLEVYTPDKVSEGEFLEIVRSNPPDIVVVVAFGEILKEEFINLPKYGVINLHFSLLPKYRGAEPVRRAILNGEKKTGVTTMYINPLLDQGDILLQREVDIREDDDYGTLSKRLSIIGRDLLLKTLELIESGKAVRKPQRDGESSYAKKFTKEELKIPWERDAVYVRNLIRALSPKPGAYTFFRGKRLKIFRGDIVEGLDILPGKIGKIEKDTLIVGCGNDALSIKSLQLEGKKVMSIDEFIRGYKPDISENFTE
ncbi:MAG TPA: methionyl-tRNA formyltransferase [Candidatus Atribacteria bacterium]|nr:methionyl-tRNA formyltransferase [Candidatus Atribacteria bacterium]